MQTSARTATTNSGFERNRFLQKKFFERHEIPTAPFRLARNHRELVVAHQALGFPGRLTFQFAEPNDPGPWIVRDFDDVPPVLRQTQGRPLLWEAFTPIDETFSVLATRDEDGVLGAQPVAVDNLIPLDALQRATELVAKIGSAAQIVGTFRVDFALCGERVLVEEVAFPTPA